VSLFGALHPSFSDDIARPHRTWPAIWELGYTWPDGVGPSEPKLGMLTVVMLTRVRLQGEVDIVEGVNDEAPNASSLHTGPGNVSPSLSSPNHALTDVTCHCFQGALCHRIAARQGRDSIHIDE